MSTVMVLGLVVEEAIKENADCGATSALSMGLNSLKLGLVQDFELLLLPYANACVEIIAKPSIQNNLVVFIF